MTWYLTPFFSVMIIAGLHGIDPELYDAADVDGAGSFGKFRYISLPALQYPLVIGGLIAAIWFGNNFDIIYASTMGGPGSSTTTLTLYLHKVMWSWFEVGYASAISAVNYGLLLAFSVIFLYLFRKYWRE
jgi:multiple sugar transport system permease protein